MLFQSLGVEDLQSFVTIALATAVGGEDDLTKDKLSNLRTVGSGFRALIYELPHTTKPTSLLTQVMLESRHVLQSLSQTSRHRLFLKLTLKHCCSLSQLVNITMVTVIPQLKKLSTSLISLSMA